MATGNLPACLKVTLPHEGGYVDHPKDPGGATNMGITHITLSAWRGYKVTKAQVKALKLSEATDIYRKKYWAPIKGDDLPAGVDLATFDFGVNSGVSRATRYLQAAVGVSQDGVIGNATIAATRKLNGKALVKKICAKRMSFLQGLAIWSTFKRGWSRRVADVEAKGVAMWIASAATMSQPSQKSVLKNEADNADAIASRQEKGALGAGGVGGVASVEAASSDPNWLLIGGAVVAFVVVAAILIAKAKHNRSRAAAYKEVAKAV